MAKKSTKKEKNNPADHKGSVDADSLENTENEPESGADSTNPGGPIIKQSFLQKTFSYFVTDEVLDSKEAVNEDAASPGFFKSVFSPSPSPGEGDPGGFSFKRIGSRFRRYRTDTRRETKSVSVYDEVEAAARPTREYWVLVIFSCIIASLGLLQNSSAVVIGAMIIAPLMNPIMGISMGTVWGHIKLFFRSLRVVFLSVMLSVVIAAAISAITPLYDLPREILLRTRPNIFDLGVALACGLVGAYTITRARLSSALPGVAISVALMPPLCTVGICLGKGNLSAAVGALVLFFTNFLGISLSACAVFWMKQVFPREHDKEQVKARVTRHIGYTAFLLFLTAIPLAWFTWFTHVSTLNRHLTDQAIESTVDEQFIHQIQVQKQDEGRPLIRLHLYTGHQISPQKWRALQARLAKIWDREVRLEIRTLRTDFMAFD